MKCNKCNNRNCSCNSQNSNINYLIKTIADLQNQVEQLESIDQKGFIRSIDGRTADNTGDLKELDPTVFDWAKQETPPNSSEIEGLNVLNVDTIEDLRNISDENIIDLQTGKLRAVRVFGYYVKGDTPNPIDYYLSNTSLPEDGGSIINVGNVKLEHNFNNSVNLSYYGSKTGLFQTMINKSNTTYNIDIPLDIGGRGIVLPENSILDFKRNGSLSGYTFSNGFISRQLAKVKIKGINTGDTKFAPSSYIHEDSIYVNALSVGFKNDGITDNSPVMNSYISTINSPTFNGNVVLFFPQGYYVFETPITYEMQSGGRKITFLGAVPAYNANFNVFDLTSTIGTANTYLGRYIPQASVFVFKNTNNLNNVTFFSIWGAYYKNLAICATSLDSTQPLVNSYKKDLPKPSEYRAVDVDTNHIINGVKLTYAAGMTDCSVENFSGYGIMNDSFHLKLNHVRITRCAIGIDYIASTAGDAIYDTLYISNCKTGIKVNNGYTMLYNTWIDECSQYGIHMSATGSCRPKFNNLHINHCNYAGIYTEGRIHKGQIIGTINRCGGYYVGIPIGSVPNSDYDKISTIYAGIIDDSTIIINTSNLPMSDPNETNNNNNFEAPLVDIVVGTRISRSNITINSVNGYGNRNIIFKNVVDVTSLYNNINIGGELGVITNTGFVKLPKFSTTVNRPVLGTINIGERIFDTTINKSINWNGTTWVDSNGTIV